MKWFRKLELKHGQSAIRNLMIVLCVLYATGWVVQLVWSDLYPEYLALSFPAIFRGQVWRLVTWLMYPPSTSPIFGLIMIYVYWTIGRDIESSWGSFEFDWFIIQGVVLHILGGLAIYFIGGAEAVIIPHKYILTPVNFSLSILLAFMATFPDARFLLFFILPVKAKYLGIVYIVITVIDFIKGSFALRASIIITLLNVVIFLIITGRMQHIINRIRKRDTWQR